MDPLSISASLIAVLQVTGTVISALYRYRTSVKDASKDAARITTEINSLRSVLESVLQVMERDESTASSRLKTLQGLMQPNGELLKCRKDLEDIKTKLGGDEVASGWKKMKHSLVWPLKEKEVAKLLESVQRAKSTMHFAITTDQMVMTLEIHGGVESLTQQFALNQLNQQRQQIRGWLSAPDPFSNHDAARKKRQPVTGEWFLRSAQYDLWKSSPGSFLWLYGIPGAGKSVLCSSIIEDIFSICQTDDNKAIIYYYFDFNENRKRNVDSLLRALVAQTLTKIPPQSKVLELLSNEMVDKELDREYLLRTLQNLVLELDQVYVVIDALDECSECEDLMVVIEKNPRLGL